MQNVIWWALCRTLVTILVRSNTFGENIKDPTDGSREKLAETSANFISVDSVVASVTDGRARRSIEKYMKRCCQKFGEEYKDANVIEGEEVLTLRPGGGGTHKVFRRHGQDSPKMVIDGCELSGVVSSAVQLENRMD